MINRIGFPGYTNVSKVSFKGREDNKYADDVLARSFIRERLEQNLDSSYNYLSEMDHLTAQQMRHKLSAIVKSRKFDEAKKTRVKSEYKVDYNKLRKAVNGCGFCFSRRDNELYTGPRLNAYPDGIKKAKEAGINTVLSLEPLDFGYCQEGKDDANENDVKFLTIKDIGHGTLHTFAVIPSSCDAPLLRRLISEPDAWVTRDENGEIKSDADKNVLDAQELFDILDGSHKDYPGPVYYGCNYGTNRTYSWNSFYDILKDCDRTKPIDNETIEKLSDLYEDLKDLYRW